jgi:hypothetical protein
MRVAALELLAPGDIVQIARMTADGAPETITLGQRLSRVADSALEIDRKIRDIKRQCGRRGQVTDIARVPFPQWSAVTEALPTFLGRAPNPVVRRALQGSGVRPVASRAEGR